MPVDRLVLIVILGLCCLSLGAQEEIITFEFDGNDPIDPITASFSCDGSPGTFGVENGAFVISDMEGFGCCGCAFANPAPECGDNSNFATLIGIPPVDLYCNISVIAEVRIMGNSGDFDCVTNPGANPTGECDLNGKDAMKIVVRLDGEEFEIGSYCGSERNGTFRVDNLTPRGGQGLLVIEITGGTQEPQVGYVIESIRVEGTQVPFVPYDILVPPNPLGFLCDGTDPLVLTAQGGSGSATYTWSLNGILLPDNSLILDRVPVTLADAGTYSVTISDPGQQCSESVVTETIQVMDCTAPMATFANLNTAFCYDADILNLPPVSDEGFAGTWEPPNGTMLNTIAPIDSLIFTPDPSTGASPFRTAVTLFFIETMGNFPNSRAPICTDDGPGSTIDLISEFSLDITKIEEVSAFGRNFFNSDLAQLSNVDVSVVNPGPHTLTFTSIFSGSCAFETIPVDIDLIKIDRVSSSSITHCQDDTDLSDFNSIIGVDVPAGQWMDMAGSGVDLSDPTNVDLSGLPLGTFLFNYSSAGNMNCQLPEGQAILTVDVIPGASINVGTFSPERLCRGDGSLFRIGNQDFDENNPTGNVTLFGAAANGCDSLVMVDLIYQAEIQTELRRTDLCEGDGFEVTVGTQTFNEQNPTGTEPFRGSNGCDSLVVVDLVFASRATRTISPSNLCSGDLFNTVVNGVTYDESNPAGTETVMNLSGGCDTVVTIDLVFQPQGQRTISPSNLCEGDGFSIEVDGVIYDENNTNGVGSVPGPMGSCDSIITVALTFQPRSTRLINPPLCEGDPFSVSYNGTTYDESNPTGTEEVPDANGGCDSLITIDLVYKPLLFGSETHDGCEGDGYSVMVGGVTYDESNPVATISLPGSNGCDSIITVDLIYKPNETGQELYAGQEGDGYEVSVGSTTYNEGNPSGTERLTAANGCDSVVTITLLFIEGRTGEETYTGCQGDGYEVMVGNSLYNEDNPGGLDSLLTSDGIDSVVTTTLTFLSPATLTFMETTTTGGGFSITLNGITYGESRPIGQDTIPNAAANGCDSIIVVSLTFVEALITQFDTTLCIGDPFSRTVGTSIYDEQNTSGIDTLQTSDGIDSLVSTTLTYVGSSMGEVIESRCVGDGYEITIGNSTYNETNPSGIDTLFGMSATGCDSIVMTSLTYNSDIVRQNPVQLCPGETITVGNSVYSADNLSGTDTISTMSGCDTIVMTNVTIDSITVDICTTPDCDGQGNGTVKIFNLRPGSMLTATVDGQDFPFTDSVVIDNLAGGQYTVDVASSPMCMISGFAEVGSGGGETLAIEVTEVGDSLMLDISFTGIIDIISWDASSGIVCSDCNSLLVDGTTANVYTLNVTDDMGCTYIAVLNVSDMTNVNPDPSQYYISNAITDLGGAGNQRLFLQTADPTILSYDLAVYSRWGSLVFDARGLTPNQASQGWDGFFSNQAVSTGVYIYMVTLSLADGSTAVDYGDVVFLR